MAIEFAQTLASESVVLISGKTSNRDDRVSVFVDSIVPLTQWVAKIAKKVTLDIRDGAVLQDVKKALIALPLIILHFCCVCMESNLYLQNGMCSMI